MLIIILTHLTFIFFPSSSSSSSSSSSFGKEKNSSIGLGAMLYNQ